MPFRSLIEDADTPGYAIAVVGDGEPGALVCLETEQRVWDGFWTTDPERVAAIEASIARELSGANEPL